MTDDSEDLSQHDPPSPLPWLYTTTTELMPSSGTQTDPELTMIYFWVPQQNEIFKKLNKVLENKYISSTETVDGTL